MYLLSDFRLSWRYSRNESPWMIVLKHECCCYCCYASFVHTNSVCCCCMNMILSMISLTSTYTVCVVYSNIPLLEFLILWAFQRFYFIDRILLSTEYGMSCKMFYTKWSEKNKFMKLNWHLLLNAITQYSTFHPSLTSIDHHWFFERNFGFIRTMKIQRCSTLFRIV